MLKMPFPTDIGSCQPTTHMSDGAQPCDPGLANGLLTLAVGPGRPPTGQATESTLSPATALLVSAPVGQTAMHSPHETQVLEPMGASRSNAMRAP